MGQGKIEYTWTIYSDKVSIAVAFRAQLLKAWLAHTRVKYHDNL